MHTKLFCTNAWAYAEYLHTLDSEDRFLTRATADQAVHCGMIFLRTYMHLAKEAWDSGTFLWKTRPKHQLSAHAHEAHSRKIES